MKETYLRGDMYYAETGKEHEQNIILARSK